MARIELINKKGILTGDWFDTERATLYEEAEPTTPTEILNHTGTCESLYKTSKGNWVLLVKPAYREEKETATRLTDVQAYWWFEDNGHEIPRELESFAPKDREV